MWCRMFIRWNGRNTKKIMRKLKIKNYDIMTDAFEEDYIQFQKNDGYSYYYVTRGIKEIVGDIRIHIDSYIVISRKNVYISNIKQDLYRYNIL